MNRRALIAGVAIALVSLLLGVALPDDDGLVAPAVGQATVTVAPDASGPIVPRSYFGISTEYWALPVFERRMPLLQRVLALLHADGNGPFVLRVGGDSADHSFWEPQPRRIPAWAFALTPAWLQHASSLVRASRLRLILDLNLVTASPTTAADWARAAQRGLPRHSILDYEIGNEPDIYSRSFWRAVTAAGSVGAAVLPRELSAAIYTHDFLGYASSLAGAAPGVPLAGPALANPVAHAGWFPALITGARQSLGLVTAHRYPLSACALPHSHAYPTVARVLSEAVSTEIANTLRRPVALAHRAGLRFRLTELNSVTCGGRPGVSDTFATALWAPDALFELLRAGVDGVNLHVRADAINAAFALSDGGLTARPLLYGLIAFVRTLGVDPARLVPAPVSARASLHLKAWAVRDRGAGLNVLLIDKGNRPVRVYLRIPASHRSTVQWLRAPAAGARTGVTLGGQRLARDGSWIGRAASATITPGPRGYAVTVPRLSAVLLETRVGVGPG